MQLYYYRVYRGNFGDDLNDWLWDELLPGWREWDSSVTLLGVGTILNSQIELPKTRKLVIGSGFGYGTVPDIEPTDMWDIRAVRGPYTAEKLSIDKSLGIIDPAMMIPLISGFSTIEKTGKLPLFIPHHSNVNRHPWEQICSSLGLKYVSPQGDSKDVIREIAAARLVIAESMHAAILADAFRTEWIPVDVSGTLNHFKWNDFAESMKVELRVKKLFPEFPFLARQIRLLVGRDEPDRIEGPTARSSGGSKSQLWRRQLRIVLERYFIRSRLRKALAEIPHLSDSQILHERQATFQSVLDSVRRTYAP
jgi:succinoglycan biosynthesis protein ExoV